MSASALERVQRSKFRRVDPPVLSFFCVWSENAGKMLKWLFKYKILKKRPNKVQFYYFTSDVAKEVCEFLWALSV